MPFFFSKGNVLAIRLGTLKYQDGSSADVIFLILNPLYFIVVKTVRDRKKTLLILKHSKS